MATPEAQPSHRVSHAAAARILATRDPVIARLVADAGLPRLRRAQQSHLATLVQAIVAQQPVGAASGSVPASMAGVRMRPRRLVLVGSVVVDVLLYVDRLPDRGGDLLARQMGADAGGGFNVLVAAVRLGMEAAYGGGRTGAGVFGARARHALEQAGIAALLPPDEGADTGVVIGLVEPDGERTFVTAPGTESRLAPDDLQALPLRVGDAVYVSGYDLVYPVSGPSLQEWLPRLAEDLLVAIDPGPLVADIPAERLQRVLGRADLLSLNAGEAATLSGSRTRRRPRPGWSDGQPRVGS